jgi:shikimate kinase/3-dehydroquinate synthase
LRPIVLSGFMGTGKSTVGPLVAQVQGVPFIDTDERIAQEAGTMVAELWRREGEPAFRAREKTLVAELLADPAARVIAFGGGTVTDRSTRHFALERATVITLSAAPGTIAGRVADAPERPNLWLPQADTAGAGDVAARRRARMGDLLEQRAEAYGEAHAVIATDAIGPDAVAAEVCLVAERNALVMPLGRRSYAIDLPTAGAGVARLAEVLARAEPSHVVVVTDANVGSARGLALGGTLRSLQAPHTLVTLVPGEQNKTLGSVSKIWDAALAAHVDRRAIVLAFGGGVVGDLASFAASTLLRGLRVVQVPTTLLAMVDASVGGKTGFDHAVGKNLVGTFHQPHAVIIDLDHLSTLPPREVRSGLAEMVKVALVGDATLLDEIEKAAPGLADGRPEALAPLVRRAVAAKIRIVREDERESGTRALLNLGHTIGHALEAHGRYERYLHGEAVAVGTLAELRVGAALSLTPGALVHRVRALLTQIGLPTEAEPGELAAAWPFVQADKKRDGPSVALPVVRSAGLATVERVELECLRKTLASPG